MSHQQSNASRARWASATVRRSHRLNGDPLVRLVSQIRASNSEQWAFLVQCWKSRCVPWREGLSAAEWPRHVA